MNTHLKFKVFFTLLIIALFLAILPTQIAYSQVGGGYTCGQWHFSSQKPAGWWFTPYGSQSEQSWYLRYQGGSEAPWGFDLDGSYMKIWNPEFDPQQNSEWYLPSEILIMVNMGVYETTSTCEPIINFWADNETITTGECTVIHWNADASGLDSTDLDGNAVNPSGGDTQVCPSESTSYTLRVNTSGGELSQTLSINVIQPTSTPLPINTPIAIKTKIIPTKTRIPSAATNFIVPTDILPTQPAPINNTPPQVERNSKSPYIIGAIILVIVFFVMITQDTRRKEKPSPKRKKK
jgi:hypothetical protein